MANEFSLVRKYWDLGGPSLVAKALYSKAESIFGVHNSSDGEFRIELNRKPYTVSGDWSMGQWRQFERDVMMPEVTRPMREHLSEGDIMIDIGTARGDTTLYGHSLVGEQGLVYAIEPDVTQFKSLRENIERNNLKSVEYYNMAVGHKEGKVAPKDVVGQTTEYFQSLIEEIDSINIITLDRFVDENESPDLVKIDVDGAEDAVLRGGSKNVLGEIPIILEIHSSELLKNRHEFLQYIFDFSNEIKYLAAQGMAPSEHKYGERLESPDDLSQDVEVNLLVQ